MIFKISRVDYSTRIDKLIKDVDYLKIINGLLYKWTYN